VAISWVGLRSWRLHRCARNDGRCGNDGVFACAQCAFGTFTLVVWRAVSVVACFAKRVLLVFAISHLACRHQTVWWQQLAAPTVGDFDAAVAVRCIGLRLLFFLVLPMFHMSHLGRCLVMVAVVCGLAGCGSKVKRDGPPMTATVVTDELFSPWDIAFLPTGELLVTEKCAGLSLRDKGGKLLRLVGNEKEYALQAKDWFCEGQSGVHGVVVDPAFASGQNFVYVFSASNLSEKPRFNRVSRFRMNPADFSLSERVDIVPDIAFKELENLGGPGAHSGGRMRFGSDGYLWITTGDNHTPDLPQHPQRLGGKVLRVDRDGKAAPDNGAPANFDPRIFSYGHRNPQGIAIRPNSTQVFTAEHGPNHSDEVNLLKPGGNYGWDPQKRPDLDCDEGYCGYAGDIDSMPMTDKQRFPEAIDAVSNNAGRSDGTGPAEFLNGPQWREWDGALAVAVMRDLRLDLLQLDAAGALTKKVAAQLEDLRLRCLLQGPDGALWACTDDGRILRIQLK
jgi:aldose sugar dehydrogenase